MRKTLIHMLVAGAALVSPTAWVQDQAPPPSGSTLTLRVNSDLVLTNVVVRDKKTGQIARGLTEKDFTVTEDGKPQRIVSFDFESVDQAAPLSEATINASAPNGVFGAKTGTATQEQLRNHRLIVMFFDITSMQPEDVERAQEAARNYINKQMHPADLVAVISLDATLSLDQDFTASKDLLLKAVNSYSGTQGAGFGAGATSTTNQVEDATSFTADEQEYNDINTDRELFAIEDISKSLAYLNEKKSLLYFSGGIQRDGIENQASMHAAINAAVRANVSIYSVDARGLQAISPLGDASTGSLRGANAFNGAALQNNLRFEFQHAGSDVDALVRHGRQGVLRFERLFAGLRAHPARHVGLLRDRLPLDRSAPRRALPAAFASKSTATTSSSSTGPATMRLRTYRHSTKDDRERELQDELASDLPATDMAVYLQALYFRTGQSRFYVPVSLVVPGSQIPFVKGGDRDKATLDIIGQVRDMAGHDIGDVRDTVKLAIDQAQQVRQKNVQYTTGFTLPVGKYHVKFVVRENETGRMGSFETDLNVPDLHKAPLKMSSVVLASQRMPAGKEEDSPLVRDGQQLVPNLPHVFRQDQHLLSAVRGLRAGTRSGRCKAGCRKQTGERHKARWRAGSGDDQHRISEWLGQGI